MAYSAATASLLELLWLPIASSSTPSVPTTITQSALSTLLSSLQRTTWNIARLLHDSRSDEKDDFLDSSGDGRPLEDVADDGKIREPGDPILGVGFCIRKDSANYRRAPIADKHPRRGLAGANRRDSVDRSAEIRR